MSVEQRAAVTEAEEVIHSNPFLDVKVSKESAQFIAGMLECAEWMQAEGTIDYSDAESAECMTEQFIKGIESGRNTNAHSVEIAINREQVKTLEKITSNLRGEVGLSLAERFALSDSYLDVSNAYNSAYKNRNKKTVTQRLRDLLTSQ